MNPTNRGKWGGGRRSVPPAARESLVQCQGGSEERVLISIASGKGGTGKTTLAVNLALTLSRHGAVQLVDADVEEPNAHTLLAPVLEGREEVSMPVPSVDLDRCTACGRCQEVCAFNAILVAGENVLVLPELCHGCGGCARLCPEGAIRETPRPLGVIEWGLARGMPFMHGRLRVGEAISPPIIHRLRDRARPDRMCIVDSPPGTSCPMVAAVRGSDLCVLVTEPTPFGLHDLRLAVDTLRKMGVPAAVVVNRAGIGDDGVGEYVRAEGLPLLMEMPFDRELAAVSARGLPVCQEIPAWRERFSRLGEDLMSVMDNGGR